MKLSKFLNKKPLYYKEIDHSFMPNIFNAIKDKFINKQIIHVVGTNGKGSTGRFLAQLLRLANKSVGHYTSPHIFSFNERFYINDSIVSDEDLQNAHERLWDILSDEIKEKISYFEYATLLTLPLFEKCDFVILEAGMGAEYDATNVFDKQLCLFTPIGLDHVGMLGNNLEEISRTKLISMAKNAILNDEMNDVSVKIAKDIALQKNSNLFFARDLLNENDFNDIKKYIDKFNLANFQYSNLALAFSATKFLKIDVSLSNLKNLDLQGRMQRVAENIIVDVGHNELCAKKVLENISSNDIVLVYNSFLDKDIKGVLKLFKGRVKRVEILDYPSDRELGGEKIIQCLDELDIKWNKFNGVKNDEKYLVFGSFLLVEHFLRNYFER
ncbi:folylpolyglutamate synthase [Campylobacter sputorum subsp. bubulus]|uniref:Folylpolyglutamate synthase n=2 Tax=Campylobacter sputorum TaxID=206 RepID=A0A381DHF4_9BACT|nr:Mur ligase family protein [Campylobacter sputorum]ASM34973.1 bifunctional folypolyglutamate synthetase / dihydrofolate synthetase [Campylobacter sputorum aubsp. sputorum RM3237]KAB0581899.1 bifunctional folylpolyglutamate synthase/dihydrofolate synthase [Campylobacter sputorum subsp. sputorum]QEL05164.1 bifunctional folypolyglutamate synthetase / dihydrofolate synthetase [Campylobacter sputorum subsp. sputorum]SUX09536.1 folylpolyglutamate synthase [Campylobacter sputorum subsp. sputorum]SU